MAQTTVSSGNKVIQWDSDFFVEYIRDSLFTRYMGTDENAIIQVKENLTKQRGDKISVPLITRLTGDGVRGNGTLEGNEEALGNYNHDITVYPLRNGVAVTEWDEQKTVIDLRDAGKVSLKNWIMDKGRDGVIAALMSMGGKAYLASQAKSDSNYTAVASEAEKDTFLAANSDRFLFGSAKSNNAANDHSAALANVDSTNDKLTAAVVRLAKRMAKVADPHIRPVKTMDGEEWFVLFCNSMCFRDLATDLAQTNRDGWLRFDGLNGESKNPLFRGGDLIVDGVICREVPELPSITGVGASSIDVGANLLCGAQALGWAWAQRTKSRTNVQDYGFLNGVAISEIRGIEKLLYNSKQHGVLTVYASAVADT